MKRPSNKWDRLSLVLVTVCSVFFVLLYWTVQLDLSGISGMSQSIGIQKPPGIGLSRANAYHDALLFANQYYHNKNINQNEKGAVDRGERKQLVDAVPSRQRVVEQPRRQDDDEDDQPNEHSFAQQDSDLKISFELNLPTEHDVPSDWTDEQVLKRYGFNLRNSNRLPVYRQLPDVRHPSCATRYQLRDSDTWTLPVQDGSSSSPGNGRKELARASVIIIFYDEPLSTLLRNLVSLLNLTPWALLGEVLLINDNSSLEQLALLPGYLALVEQQLNEYRRKGPDPSAVPLVRMVTLDEHAGIVATRNRGAREAKFPVLVFTDSHAEVTPGWLEPLIAEIVASPRTAVVPHIRGLHVANLAVDDGPFGPWVGGFNWRLSFTIHPYTRQPSESPIDPIETAVMPGGLFAVAKAEFWRLGGYDKGIMFYGGEHMDLSFRTWMCGGRIVIQPCSNIGHIYRDFNRFAVDPHLKDRPLTFLDTNDMRVAEVWLDQYKSLFYETRGLRPNTTQLGSVADRHELRRRLQCKSFQWFIDNVAPPQLFVPSLNPSFKGALRNVVVPPTTAAKKGREQANRADATAVPKQSGSGMCIDTMQRKTGLVGMYQCHGLATQSWRMSPLAYFKPTKEALNSGDNGSKLKGLDMQSKDVGLIHIDDKCLVLNQLAQCSTDPATVASQAWLHRDSLLHVFQTPSMCLKAHRQMSQPPSVDRCNRSDPLFWWSFAPFQ